MTACSNSRRHGAVVAALVGAMSLGAPAVALAANGGIETLAVDAWKDAAISAATDGQGNQLSGDLSQVTLAPGKYLVPTQVKTADGILDVDDLDVTYSPKVAGTASTHTGLESGKSYAYKDANGNWVNFTYSGTLTAVQAEAYFSGSLYVSNDPNTTVAVQEGAYTVTASQKGDNTKKATLTFRIKKSSENPLEGAYVTLGGSKDICYTGSDLSTKIKFHYADGDEFTPSSTSWIASNGASSTVIDAGNYVAAIKDADGNEANISFTVNKYDISKADLTPYEPEGDISVVSTTTLAKSLTGLSSDVDVISIKNPDGALIDISTGNVSTSGAGAYTATVEVKGTANTVAGKKDVTFWILNDDMVGATIKYGKDSIAAGATLDFDLSHGEKFDASKVSVDTKLGPSQVAAQFSGDALEITYKDSKGNEVSAEDVAGASVSSTFTMTVRVKPHTDWETGRYVGGTAGSVTINVKGTDVDEDEGLYFYLDGALSGDNGSVTYDGTDAMDKLQVKVVSGDKELVEGTDYTVELTKQSGSRWVAAEDAVDAGTYKVTVKPVTFAFEAGQSGEFDLTVNKVTLSTLVADVDTMKLDADEKTGQITIAGNDFYVPYTGEAVEVPAVTYEVKDSKGNYTYKQLPADAYNVVNVKDSKGNVVKEVVDPGTYTVKIALKDAAAGNYIVNSDTFSFTVKEFGHFTDVDSAKWYSVPVEKAYENEYINGIAGTTLYMPEAKMTRADAICVLFNMASGYVGTNPDYSYDVDHGYVTGFSDVNGNEYFAKALAWAKASGIVSGDTGTTNFRPYDSVSRQEFAAMLANFAKAKGAYAAPSDGALDAVEDADTVSSWATEVVSWAVENGVMGNKGYVYATSDISRAEVAAMAVNYQPEKLPASY